MAFSDWGFLGFMLFNTIQAMGELSILYPVSGGFYNLSNRFIDKSWLVSHSLT